MTGVFIPNIFHKNNGTFQFFAFFALQVIAPHISGIEKAPVCFQG